jgi:1-deoxy-D-xylulose-5-phosphate reductoisomerase
VAILGSTGSIGVNATKVIRAHPDQFKVATLAAGKNVERLSKQIEEFRPSAVAVSEERSARELKRRHSGVKGPEVFFGAEGAAKVATMDEVDMVISAMAGAAGLVPTHAAVLAGKDVALANKETMVMAGPLVMSAAGENGVSIIPVDSEHSAIFQSLHGHPREDVRQVILTASGGPFRNVPYEHLKEVTAAQALNHPNWDMGRKITIDSATLMNKGLEAIEAKWLFNLRMDQISILVHPQSIVHSMVEYRDGSVIAQLGVPDMIIPISYALSFPRHIENELPRLELDRIGSLSFEKPDLKRFRCLDLALTAAETGQSMPAVLNGANEIAVEWFLEGRIRFLDIPDLIAETMEMHRPQPIQSIEAVMEADLWARKKVIELADRLAS